MKKPFPLHHANSRVIKPAPVNPLTDFNIFERENRIKHNYRR